MKLIAAAIAIFPLLVFAEKSGEIEITGLGERVLVATGGTWDSNLVAIAGDDDIVIVDTHDTPATTAQALRKIRLRFPDHPIRYVINTHGHDDHVWGNEVFAGTPIIAHPKTHDYMALRKEELVPFFAGQWIRDLQAKLESSAGSREDEKELREQLKSAKEAHEKWGQVKVTLPTLTLNDGATLRFGDRAIEIVNLGAAHSEGDLAVHVPGEQVLIVGDLVGKQRSLVRLDGEQGDVVGLAAALGHLSAEYGASTRHLITGHGPVGKPAWLDASRRYVEYVLEEVTKARKRGWSLEQAKNQLTLEKLRDFEAYSELRQNNIEAAWNSLERREAGGLGLRD